MLRWQKATILTASVAFLAGCYSPGGGWFPYTGGATTYSSTETRPTTVTIVDTRTGEAIFAMDIPVGRQLTIDFDEGSGDDPIDAPDLMRYELFVIGTTYGGLDNSMTVPNANCRRIDVTFRPAPEAPPGAAGRVLGRDGLPQPIWTDGR